MNGLDIKSNWGRPAGCPIRFRVESLGQRVPALVGKTPKRWDLFSWVREYYFNVFLLGCRGGIKPTHEVAASARPVVRCGLGSKNSAARRAVENARR